MNIVFTVFPPFEGSIYNYTEAMTGKVGSNPNNFYAPYIGTFLLPGMYSGLDYLSATVITLVQDTPGRFTFPIQLPDMQEITVSPFA